MGQGDREFTVTLPYALWFLTFSPTEFFGLFFFFGLLFFSCHYSILVIWILRQIMPFSIQSALGSPQGQMSMGKSIPFFDPSLIGILALEMCEIAVKLTVSGLKTFTTLKPSIKLG